MSYTMIQINHLINKLKKIGVFLILLMCLSCNKNAQLEKEIEAISMDLKVERFDQAFMKRIIEVRYYNGISLFKKLKRVPGMLKNMYKEIVDMSYR